MNRLKERANQLKMDVPAVILALREKRTPWYAKIIAAIVVVYALSPVDLIPDFIPVLGYLDDIIILPALIALCIRCIPDEVFNDCRNCAGEMLNSGKNGTWYYAVPFVLIWVLVIGLVVLALI